MFPHQNSIRERRVGQPPMAPQHIMGMPQQGPSMLMPMPTQQIQIMTQNHFTSQNSYSTQGQGNVSSFVPAQQVQQKSAYHHAPFSSPQIIVAKQNVNRNKNYRKDYSVIKDPLNYNINERNNQINNFVSHEYNSINTYNRYNQGHNGYYQIQVQKERLSKNTSNSIEGRDIVKNVKEKEIEKDGGPDTNMECPALAQSLASGTKEKTPMCLVNELARFNKITHQYRLTNEQGPAHKKSFTVTLTLGTEEYTAEAPSIKKAQHSAAAQALYKTSFSHPTPKAHKNVQSGKSNITPTVELNALAMKRGEPAIYKLLEATQNHPINYQPQAQSFSMRRPGYYAIQRGLGRRGRNLFSGGLRMPLKYTFTQTMHFTVSLKVGSLEFFGEGVSPQSARHDAAAKALSQLKMLPSSTDEEKRCPPQNENSLFNGNKDVDPSIKSPISLVHEIALRRNMNVAFEVIDEKGPPHLKIFVTKCTVGNLSTTGDGSKKKISKKRAAENMLAELKKLTPVSPTCTSGSANPVKMKKKFTQSKKKSRNLIKIVQHDIKTESVFGDENPISKLIQIQHLKKEKEPSYTLLEERGTPKKKEFLMEVSVNQMKATGTGSSKKLAKKAAAHNLLILMGYVRAENAAKTQDGSQNESHDRKVKFADTEKGGENSTGGTGGPSGRQLKPGIYVMSSDQQFGSVSPCSPAVNMETTATIAKELLMGGNSPTADALVEKSTLPKSTSQTGSYRPKQQLLYLAELLKFQVHFSDFPKGNHSEYLSLVTMSTDPSHVCHGSGPSIEESQDQAALTALTALSEIGLDSVTAQNSAKESKKTGNVMPSANI